MDWKPYFLVWVETFALTSSPTLFTKELAKRTRPYVYSDYGNGDKYSKDARASFCRGILQITASSTFL